MHLGKHIHAHPQPHTQAHLFLGFLPHTSTPRFHAPFDFQKGKNTITRKTPSEAKNINCPKLPKYLQHYHVSTITVELIRAFGNFIKHFLVLKFQSKSLMVLWTELLYKVIINYLYPINTYHTFSGATNIRTWDCGMGSDKHSFRLSHPIDCYKSRRS